MDPELNEEHAGHVTTPHEEKLKAEVETEAEELIESEDAGTDVETNDTAETEEEEEEHTEPEGPRVTETPEMVKIRERLSEIRGKMLTLKWDDEHGQLNPGKKALYDKLKKECVELEIELKKGLSAQGF